VFVAGATGVIGRHLIPRLVKDGHQVTGMTRSPGKAAALKTLGATPVVCDVYDQAQLTAVVRDSPGDVVVHLLTDLPARFNPRDGTTATDRLRREGTRNLLTAAQAAGTRRFIAESIAFLYRPGSPTPRNEQDAPWLDAPGSFAETVRAVIDLERQVQRAPSLDGIILRFGWLYGPGTWYAPDGSIAEDVRHRRYPIVGEGSGTWSFVHADDAASAVLAAAKRGQPGTYNIVDDDPAPMHTWLPAFAQAIGAPNPPHLQNSQARAAAGRPAVAIASQLAGASNTKAKNKLGWMPQYPSWRAGFGAPPARALTERRRRMTRTLTTQRTPRSRAPDAADAVHPLSGGERLDDASAAPPDPA
jgi:2-alkyl-3-oxoalkanoate reductase